MPLAAGTRLDPYEVLAPIGAGGMGEVYKACDTKLDRLGCHQSAGRQWHQTGTRSNQKTSFMPSCNWRELPRSPRAVRVAVI
jgi:serine/threonine protein kinase